jgi:hypothetical protein
MYGMTPIGNSVEDYLAMRRALGFQLRLPARLLRDFASFFEAEGASHVTTDLALRWAKQPVGVQPAQWAYRLSVVRRFAHFLSATDPRTELPPLGLLPHRYRRKRPYIYRDDEVRKLLHAARRIPSPTGLRAASYLTLIGLLAVSGLRISEANGPCGGRSTRSRVRQAYATPSIVVGQGCTTFATASPSRLSSRGTGEASTSSVASRCWRRTSAMATSRTHIGI